MNKNLSFCLALCLCSINSFAQSATDGTPTPTNKASFGFSVHQFQNDFGLGLHFISPYFAQSKIAIRLGGNLQWFEHVSGDETTWTPYANFQFGVRGRRFVVEKKVTIYGEG